MSGSAAAFLARPTHILIAVWGTTWIERHVWDATTLHKPVMLGEFGLLDKSTRNPTYKAWTEAFHRAGGDGALYWILSGKKDNGSLYADYDGFTVYCPSPVCTTLSNFARMMAEGRPSFAPVADHDPAVTEADTPATLAPAPNDIAYDGAVVVPTSIDVDPAGGGRQTAKIVTGGTFALQPDGTVIFAPEAGFAGRAQTTYTIEDSRGGTSNQANLIGHGQAGSHRGHQTVLL